MTEETKKPAPPTRAERTVRVVFRFSLIAAFAVISSCVLLLECLHDEERRIEMSQEQDSDSLRPLPITIIILYFSVVTAIATIIIWLVVLVLVRYFGKSAPLIGRPPVPPEIKMNEESTAGDDAQESGPSILRMDRPPLSPFFRAKMRSKSEIVSF